jgi:spore coat protein U-like protein
MRPHLLTFRLTMGALAIAATCLAPPVHAQYASQSHHPCNPAWPCTTPPSASSCALSTRALDFGSYRVLSPAPNDTTGTIVISCQGGGNRTVQIQIGPGTGGPVGSRALTRAGQPDKLNYQIYSDAARRVAWGDNTGGTRAVYVTIQGTARLNVPVYGRITPRQDVSAASYADSMLVTIVY